jgi:hypothetical protein
MRIGAGCLAFAAALSSALTVVSAAGGQTVEDPVGDADGAPDVCDVIVSRDGPTVEFRIRFADRPSLEPGERVTLVLDGDGTRSTGNPGLAGADALASYGTLGAKTFAGELVRWRDDRWEPFPGGSRHASFEARRNVLRVVLDRAVLPTAGFRWSAVTFAAGRGRGSDAAPDSGMRGYSAGGKAGRPPQCGSRSIPA